jgi:putative hydrolases of HD superfamily
VLLAAPVLTFRKMINLMTDPYGFFRFLHLVGRLKQIKRAGWVQKNVPEQESVADHTFRLCVLVFVLAKQYPDRLDRNRCLSLALVHDLAESIVGDITPHDTISMSEKYQLEEQAFKTLSDTLGDDELLRLWYEFEKQETPEARFVRELDLFEMLFQALEYQSYFSEPDLNLDEFMSSVLDGVENNMIRELIQLLVADQGAIHGIVRVLQPVSPGEDIPVSRTGGL